MKKAYEIYSKIEVAFCGIILVTICGLAFLAALGRKFGMPLQSSLDIVQLLFAWLAFIGADVALRNKSLVGVDLVMKKFPEKFQTIVRVICYLLMIGVLSIFVVKGIELSIASWDRAFQTIPISYSFVTLSLPVGSALMIFSCLYLIKGDLKSLLAKGKDVAQ